MPTKTQRNATKNRVVSHTPARRIRWKRLHVVDPATGKKDFFHTQFVDAKTPLVEIPVVFEEVYNESIPGMPWDCLLVKGVLQYVAKVPNVFPHECLYPYFTARAAYIVDKKVNKAKPPARPHSVRYMVDVTDLLDAFDDQCITLAMIKAKFGEQYILRMWAAKKRGGDEAPHARDTRRRKPAINLTDSLVKENIRYQGAFRRARVAGLI